MSSELYINSINNTILKSNRLSELKEVATALEANFLAEMLKYSGLNDASGSFSGGPGEEAFASLLNREYATALANSGGVGLAESIFKSLAKQEGLDV